MWLTHRPARGAQPENAATSSARHSPQPGQVGDRARVDVDADAGGVAAGHQADGQRGTRQRPQDVHPLHLGAGHVAPARRPGQREDEGVGRLGGAQGGRPHEGRHPVQQGGSGVEHLEGTLGVQRQHLAPHGGDPVHGVLDGEGPRDQRAGEAVAEVVGPVERDAHPDGDLGDRAVATGVVAPQPTEDQRHGGVVEGAATEPGDRAERLEGRVEGEERPHAPGAGRQLRRGRCGLGEQPSYGRAVAQGRAHHDLRPRRREPDATDGRPRSRGQRRDVGAEPGDGEVDRVGLHRRHDLVAQRLARRVGALPRLEHRQQLHRAEGIGERVVDLEDVRRPAGHAPRRARPPTAGGCGRRVAARSGRRGRASPRGSRPARGAGGRRGRRSGRRPTSVRRSARPARRRAGAGGVRAGCPTRSRRRSGPSRAPGPGRSRRSRSRTAPGGARHATAASASTSARARRTTPPRRTSARRPRR